jgi:hypothetical protein
VSAVRQRRQARPKPKGRNVLTCRDKRRFRDGKAARKALGTIKDRGERRAGKPQRAYACPECGGWHLTSEAR